jgi:hypothetical protein
MSSGVGIGFVINIRRSPPMNIMVRTTIAPARRPRPVEMSITQLPPVRDALFLSSRTVTSCRLREGYLCNFCRVPLLASVVAMVLLGNCACREISLTRLTRPRGPFTSGTAARSCARERYPSWEWRRCGQSSGNSPRDRRAKTCTIAERTIAKPRRRSTARRSKEKLHA